MMLFARLERTVAIRLFSFPVRLYYDSRRLLSGFQSLDSTVRYIKPVGYGRYKYSVGIIFLQVLEQIP